jgi:hypothetical protein
MRLFTIICQGSINANIERVLAEPNTVAADHLLTLCGIDANAKLGHHDKCDEP